MIWLDENLFLHINGLVGRYETLDSFMKLVVGEYFIPVAIVMVLVVMWFLGKDIKDRDRKQRAVFTALIGVGFANLAVTIINNYYDRLRPFEALEGINVIFYEPTDPSFPSNTAAVGFAFAMGAWFGSRKAAVVILLLTLLWTFARVYCGVHYPLDVLGGAVIGIICTLIAFGFLRLIEPIAARLLSLLRFIYLA